MPFSPLFSGGQALTKIEDRKRKGTLILASLLEDHVELIDPLTSFGETH